VTGVEDAQRLVTARAHKTPLDEGSVARILSATIDQFPEPTDQHAVWWNTDWWSDTDAWSSENRGRIRALADALDDHSRKDGWRLISREFVFGLVDDPLELFLATMAWGFGERGYGWRRTSDIVNSVGEARVARAVENLRCACAQGPAAAWRAWSRGGEAKLPGLDTAFASKVAYFASFDRATGHGPLIADKNTSWAL
jgi:hypothetical protein